MSRWLSEAWFEDVRRVVADAGVGCAGLASVGAPDAPVHPDGMRVHVVVTGVADGDVRWSCTVQDGSMTVAGPGPTGRADVVVTISVDDARRVLCGDLGLSSAYMQGLAKVEGRTGAVLDLLACSAGERFGVVRSAVAGITED
jgi:hypothetical protein